MNQVAHKVCLSVFEMVCRFGALKEIMRDLDFSDKESLKSRLVPMYRSDKMYGVQVLPIPATKMAQRAIDAMLANYDENYRLYEKVKGDPVEFLKQLNDMT